MAVAKLESLSGGSGVHVFLVLWKAARAVGSYAQKSITDLEIGGSDFTVLEALLHKGPLPVNEIGKKVLLTSGSMTVAVDRLEQKRLVERRAHGTDRRARSFDWSNTRAQQLPRLECRQRVACGGRAGRPPRARDRRGLWPAERGDRGLWAHPTDYRHARDGCRLHRHRLSVATGPGRGD